LTPLSGLTTSGVEVIKMKVLVIGQGGREHALVRALKQSPCVDKVIAIPGSMGMENDALCLSHSITPPEKLIAEIRDRKIDLVVNGPEGPLAEGLADCLREAGVSVFGPSAQAAQLEQFMNIARLKDKI
jgi:phosphoribosylamine--glycine ligase